MHCTMHALDYSLFRREEILDLISAAPDYELQMIVHVVFRLFF